MLFQANEHHRQFLEENPEACYGFPLAPTGRAEEIPMSEGAVGDQPPYSQR